MGRTHPTTGVSMVRLDTPYDRRIDGAFEHTRRLVY